MNIAVTAAERAAIPPGNADVASIFSTEELNVLRRLAHALYAQGMYEDAGRYFWFLSLHAPTDKRYLKGLGASQFMAKRFGEAVITYSFLTALAPKDPEVHCMCGHSLLMQGDARDARKCLEFAAALPSRSPFTERAHALLELMAR